MISYFIYSYRNILWNEDITLVHSYTEVYLENIYVYTIVNNTRTVWHIVWCTVTKLRSLDVLDGGTVYQFKQQTLQLDV